MDVRPSGLTPMVRLKPVCLSDGSVRIDLRPVDASWKVLGRMLDEVRPRALGLLLPFITQLHRTAYLEARARSIVTGLALTTHATALTGLMEEVPIEAVVGTEEALQDFARDVVRMGLESRVRGWLVVYSNGRHPSFVAPSGETYYDEAL